MKFSARNTCCLKNSIFRFFLIFKKAKIQSLKNLPMTRDGLASGWHQGYVGVIHMVGVSCHHFFLEASRCLDEIQFDDLLFLLNGMPHFLVLLNHAIQHIIVVLSHLDDVGTKLLFIKFNSMFLHWGRTHLGTLWAWPFHLENWGGKYVMKITTNLSIRIRRLIFKLQL